MHAFTSLRCSWLLTLCTSLATSIEISSRRCDSLAKTTRARHGQLTAASAFALQNFLIDTTGHIKLTDFGLASGALNPGKIEHLKHKLDEVKDCELIYRSTVEMKSIYKSIRQADLRYADSVVGSPDYMAIETLRGHTYTFSVDYWSLGCILFE